MIWYWCPADDIDPWARGRRGSVRQIVCHLVPNLSNVKVFTWNSSVLEITLGQWAHDVVSWHFSTKDSLISGPAPTLHTNVSSGRLCPCIHPITGTDASIQPFTFTKRSLGSILLLCPKLASNKNLVDNKRHCKIIQSDVANLVPPHLQLHTFEALPVDLLHWLWGILTLHSWANWRSPHRFSVLVCEGYSAEQLMELACVLFDRRDMGWSGQQAESGHYLVCLHSLVLTCVARIFPISIGWWFSRVCSSVWSLAKSWLSKQCRLERRGD